MKKARVIYNPTSGKELLKKNLADILQALEESGYEASAYATTPEENSAKNAKSFVLPTCRKSPAMEHIISPLKNRPSIKKRKQK